MKKLSIKGASWDSMFLAFAKIVTLLFGILSTKILSTGLTLSEYGTYSQANLVNTLGASLLLLGLPDALNFFYNKSEHRSADDRARTVNTIFFLELFLGVLFVAIVLVSRDLIVAYFDNPAIKILLPVVAFLPTLSNLIYFYHVLCVSVGKAKIMSFLNMVVTIVKIVFVYVAVYMLQNLIWIYVTLLALEIGQILFFNIVLWKKRIRVNPLKIAPSQISPIWKYAIPMGVYALTSSLTREISKLVVGNLAGTENLAIYSNCSKILPLDFLVTSFAVVLIPYIVKCVTSGDDKKSAELFANYMKVGYYSVWILGTMVLIAPSSMISFLYADAYVAGKAIFVIYIFDSMIRFASIHLILTSANKSSTVMLYSLLSLLLSLVLNIAFYFIFGLLGPAIATLVVALIYTYLILRKSIQTIHARWKDVFNGKEMLWLIFTLACLWAGMFFLNNLLVRIGLHVYVSMILCMAIFGFSALGIHFKKISGVLKKINSFKL